MNMEIKKAKYISHKEQNISVQVVLQNDFIVGVPLDMANTDYAEIMRQVDAGELTIEPADE